MIIIDYSQTVISNIMAELNIAKEKKLEVNLIRHMVLNTIRSYVTKFKEDYGPDIVIACDSRKYWRKDVFPNYKANRKKARQDSGLDWNLIFDTINLLKSEIKDHLPYQLVEIEGAEADDVIACYVQWLKNENEKVLIISADHDFMQLHKFNNVYQWSPTKNDFVTCKVDPKDKLFEHIIKGDKGDGVPNVLSDDDTIVDGRRQKPIQTKKLNAWKIDPTSMPHDSAFITNFERNQTLIDLSKIPDDIKDKIQSVFLNKTLQTENAKEKIKKYFQQHNLNNMIEVIEEFQ
tara:strand:+ start:178 stop:1047 length:870 start_codon:yes stop_codon:yes gene_type:complete